jgi:hypothetical protein
MFFAEGWPRRRGCKRRVRLIGEQGRSLWARTGRELVQVEDPHRREACLDDLTKLRCIEVVESGGDQQQVAPFVSQKSKGCGAARSRTQLPMQTGKAPLQLPLQFLATTHQEDTQRPPVFGRERWSVDPRGCVGWLNNSVAYFRSIDEQLCECFHNCGDSKCCLSETQ